MAKNKLGGEEPQVRDITTFEDWTARVKKHVVFDRGNGQMDRFLIYSLDTEQVASIRSVYNEQLPARPQAVLNSKGKQDPHFEERLEKYDEVVDELNHWMQFKYILAGWVIPNGIEIAGDDEDAKIANMKKSIAGDANKLFQEIIKLSNLGNEDVDFF